MDLAGKALRVQHEAPMVMRREDAGKEAFDARAALELLQRRELVRREQVGKLLDDLMVRQVFKMTRADSNKWRFTPVRDLYRATSVTIVVSHVLHVHKRLLRVQVELLSTSIVNEASTEARVLERRVLDVDASAAVLSKQGQELVRHLLGVDAAALVLNLHFVVVVCLHVDQRLLVEKELEVAIDQVECR